MPQLADLGVLGLATMGANLARNAARAGKLAYIDDAGALTYGELDARVRSAAAALRFRMMTRIWQRRQSGCWRIIASMSWPRRR